jgi:hypothetical protein
MAHPFEKMFERALKKSLDGENLVTEEALRLLKKGYSHVEINSVLLKLHKSLIDEKEEAIIYETMIELEELQ